MTKQELMETYTSEQLAEMVVKYQNASEVKNDEIQKLKWSISNLEESNGRLRSKVDTYNNYLLPRCTPEAKELIDKNSFGNVKIIALGSVFAKEVKGTCDCLYPSEELYPKIGIIVKCSDCGNENKIELDEKSECLIRNKLTDRVHELESEVEKYLKTFEGTKKERDCQIAEYQKKIAEYQKKIEELTDEKESLETRLKLLKSERDDLREEVEKLKKTKDFSDLTPIEVANMLINAEGEYEHNPIAKALYKEDKGTYRIFDIGELRQIAEHLLVY